MVNRQLSRLTNLFSLHSFTSTICNPRSRQEIVWGSWLSFPHTPVPQHSASWEGKEKPRVSYNNGPKFIQWMSRDHLRDCRGRHTCLRKVIPSCLFFFSLFFLLLDVICRKPLFLSLFVILFYLLLFIFAWEILVVSGILGDPVSIFFFQMFCRRIIFWKEWLPSVMIASFCISYQLLCEIMFVMQRYFYVVYTRVCICYILVLFFILFLLIKQKLLLRVFHDNWGWFFFLFFFFR